MENTVSDDSPLVTVLMPVYNGEKYLSESIDSILDQTFLDYEFIIINDGSTDGTSEILRNYSLKDKRIKLHHQSNQGVISALNKGLELARGKYIARMDADDVSLPDRFAKQVDFLETHPEVGVLGTGVRFMDGCGNTSDTLQFPTQHGVLRWCLCFFSPIVHPTVMMRRQIIEQAGGYAESMMIAEDYDLWRRLSCVTRLSNLKDVLLHFRKHDMNVTIVRASESQRYKVSRMMISNILNEEVPSSIVQRLWDQDFQTVSDVRPVAELVYRLYQAVVSNCELQTMEKQTIRRDVAMRLFRLSGPWALDINVWGILARSIYLDPMLVRKIVKGLFRRTILALR